MALERHELFSPAPLLGEGLDSAGVAEWEEPRDSGLLCVAQLLPTMPHFATLFPTHPTRDYT